MTRTNVIRYPPPSPNIPNIQYNGFRYRSVYFLMLKNDHDGYLFVIVVDVVIGTYTAVLLLFFYIYINLLPMKIECRFGPSAVQYIRT